MYAGCFEGRSVLRNPLCTGVLAVVGMLCACVPARAGGPQYCDLIAAGNDSAYWNNGTGPSLGKAIGQAFYAPESLLISITVWSPRSVYLGVHLYICDTDASGRPIVSPPILDGPSLTAPSPLDSGQIATLQWVFDPPLILPHRGLFVMFFKSSPCTQGEPWRLLEDRNAHYVYGSYWATNRSLSADCPIFAPHVFPETDLVFRNEYCVDATTQVLRGTWGRLKILYR